MKNHKGLFLKTMNHLQSLLSPRTDLNRRLPTYKEGTLASELLGLITIIKLRVTKTFPSSIISYEWLMKPM